MEMEDKNRSSNECSIQILFSGIEIAVQNKNRNYDKKQNKNKHNSNNQNNDSYKNDWDEYTDLYVYIIFQELIYSCGKSTEKKTQPIWNIPHKPNHASETWRCFNGNYSDKNGGIQ